MLDRRLLDETMTIELDLSMAPIPIALLKLLPFPFLALPIALNLIIPRTVPHLLNAVPLPLITILTTESPSLVRTATQIHTTLRQPPTAFTILPLYRLLPRKAPTTLASTPRLRQLDPLPLAMADLLPLGPLTTTVLLPLDRLTMIVLPPRDRPTTIVQATYPSTAATRSHHRLNSLRTRGSSHRIRIMLRLPLVARPCVPVSALFLSCLETSHSSFLISHRLS